MLLLGVLKRLACWALRFSPIVEPVEPDTLLVDVTGCERLFGGEENIAGQAVEGLARQGFRARAAIADTVGAAYAVAVAGPELRGYGVDTEEGTGRDPRGLRSTASSASSFTIVPVGQMSAFLTPLPPATLRLHPRITEKLEALGLSTIGDLLMLPRSSLPARFGPQLVLRLQQALGEVFEGVAPYHPAEVPLARLPFETPVTDGQAIASAAEHLLADVFRQMERLDLALRRLDCVLYYECTPPRVFSIGLSRASRQREHVAKLLLDRLEQVHSGSNLGSTVGWAPPTSTFERLAAPGVVGLMLVARETSPWHGGQGEFFQSREPGDDEALGCLVDRLVGRLGCDAVVRPRLVDDHQPEMAFRYVSVAEAGCEPEGSGFGVQGSDGGRGPHLFQGRGMGDGLETATVSNGSARPVRLLLRPILIRVIALVPDGPPTWFSYRGREHVVAGALGPERLETAWWRGPDVRRDYFRVTTESGEQFWIFRAAGEGRWYLHGLFA